MKYTLKHYCQNPRNNSSEYFDTKPEAVAAAKSEIETPDYDQWGQPLDFHPGSVKLFCGDTEIAFRRNDETQLTWIKQ